MQMPPAIIFVNADLNDGLKKALTTQLFINETISGTEFDARVSADPNYPTVVHLNDLRILVIRDNYHDLTNRNLADVAIFVKQGQAVVEKNNFGPPSLSLPIQRLNVYALLRFNNSPYVVILPNNPPPPTRCNDCGCPRCLGGIVVDELADSSGVYCTNPDNEYNNTAFINRK